jgi:hypothetical protein
MAVERVDGTELKFKNPGRLLLVVIGFLFWAIGFIDLLGHTSAEPDILGLYSLPFFILIILYGATIVIWFALFFNARLLSWVADAIKFIQRRLWLAIPALVGIIIALWVIFEWDRWSRLPGLQFAAFGLVVLALLILLFANWDESRGKQVWRRVVVYVLIGLLIVEAIIQLIVWFGFLPGPQKIGGNFVPYERIYYNIEGFRNDFANRKGWTFPDSEFEEDKPRILIVGGSFVQALQVEPEEQVGAQLSKLINLEEGTEDPSFDIVSIGLPGFGLSPFLYDVALLEIPTMMNYDELVVFFHLGDDFQSPEPTHNAIIYTVDPGGEVSVEPNYAKLRHDLTHFYLRGFLSLQIVETLRGNYLTPVVLSSLLRNPNQNAIAASALSTDGAPDFSRSKGYVTSNFALTEFGHAGIKSTDLVTITQGNNFIFSQTENEGRKEANQVARGILETAQEITRTNGIKLRLVTIPVFPEEFYAIYDAGDWKPEIGEYDLFLPEHTLIDIAEDLNIPILAMGNYMLSDQLTVGEVGNFYLSDGSGNFSPQGHEYFARAISKCFYEDIDNERCTP